MSESLATIKEMFKHGHPRFYEIMFELMGLHDRKNRDYASKEHPLQNFERVGDWGEKYNLITQNYEATKTSVLYMLKQLDAALKLLGRNEVGEVEGVVKRLRDVAVYSVLTMILYEEGK